MDAETGDHFVKYENCSRFFGQRPQLLQKSFGLQIRPPALNRLHQHRGQIGRLAAQQRQRLRIIIVDDQNVFQHAGHSARRNRNGLRLLIAVLGHADCAVKMAVIRTGKHRYFASTGSGSGQPQSGHDRFGTGITKGNPLHAGHIGNHLGHFTCQMGLRPQMQAALHL